MDRNRRVACHECDALLVFPALKEGQSLVCSRCKQRQFSLRKNALNTTISYSICAFVALMLAVSFPFLSFSASGQARTINLLQASSEMFEQGFYAIGALVFLFILMLPALYLGCLLLLTLSVSAKTNLMSPVFLGRVMSFILPWAMAEVFIVGTLVALIKIVELADIVIGTSFWAFICFVVLFTLICNIANKHQIWQWVDRANQR